MLITLQMVLDLHPCDTYAADGVPTSLLLDLYAGRDHYTPEEVADLEVVPTSDRRWVLSRLMTHRQCVEWAIMSARAVSQHLDDRTRGPAQAAIEAAARWLRGEAAAEECRAAAAYAAAASSAAYAAADADYAAYAADYAAYAAAASAAAARSRMQAWTLRVAAHVLGGPDPGEAPA
jgi:hypothetical protein